MNLPEHLFSFQRHPHRRQITAAFTLVELLVVIAIIAVLLGLILPAIQSARETARRLTCRSNLRQLALAVLNYESVKKAFPPSIRAVAGSDPAGPDAAARRETWAILILPFIEEQPLFNAFTLTVSPSDPVNAGPRSTRIPTLLCPSDTYNATPFMGTQGVETNAWGDDWARANYAANGALGSLHLYAWDTASTHSGWQKHTHKGMMGFNTAVRISEVVDGCSHTAMLTEVRVGITPYDPRGVWALGAAGSSSLWAHGGISGDDYGPNCSEPYADDTFNCDQMTRASGGVEALVRLNMGCCEHPPGEAGQGTSRSMHRGGIFAAMADGSVHWIDDYIDVLPSSPELLSVWDRLMLSGDMQGGP